MCYIVASFLLVLVDFKWWNRELTLKCKLKCNLNPWITHRALALIKGNREPHEAKKKSFDLGGNRTGNGRSNPNRMTELLNTEWLTYWIQNDWLMDCLNEWLINSLLSFMCSFIHLFCCYFFCSLDPNPMTVWTLMLKVLMRTVEGSSMHSLSARGHW